MNEFLILLLQRFEEQTMWSQAEAKKAILEEFNKIGNIRTLLESALLPAVTDEGRRVVIKETIREINQSF